MIKRLLTYLLQNNEMTTKKQTDHHEVADGRQTTRRSGRRAASTLTRDDTPARRRLRHSHRQVDNGATAADDRSLVQPSRCSNDSEVDSAVGGRLDAQWND